MAKKINNLDDAKKLLQKRTKQPDPVDQFAWLNQRQFNPLAQIQAPDPIIQIQNKTILTMGNYMTISGKPKAGKSAFISGAIASAITGTNCLGWQITMPQDKPNLIHLDTEQGEYEYYQSIEMVKKIAGIPNMPASFQSFRLRGIKADQIRAAIEHIAYQAGTGIIIIDGLLDTIIDFNDIHECRQITDLLRDITEKQKIGIICIIHQSKSNNYTIGHLGSFADRYSQSVLEVVKEKDISELKAVYLRSAGGIEPVGIMFDVNNKVWKYDVHTPEHHKAKAGTITDADLMNYITNAFENRSYCTWKMLEDSAKSFLKIPKNKVGAVVDQLFTMNLIRKDGNNYFINEAPF